MMYQFAYIGYRDAVIYSHYGRCLIARTVESDLTPLRDNSGIVPNLLDCQPGSVTIILRASTEPQIDRANLMMNPERPWPVLPLTPALTRWLFRPATGVSEATTIPTQN
jgi:hypothetical protein